MEKFLEKIQEEFNDKIVKIINGESFVKPFDKIHKEIREKKRTTRIYTKEQESIYSKIVTDFLKEHPDFLNTTEDHKD